MAIVTCIFVIGVALTAVFGMNNEHMLFVRVANFTNLQSQNSTVLGSSPGCLEDCALQCLSSLKCLSFQHRPSDNECVLFSTLSFGTSVTTAGSNDGWEYFRGSGERCRVEFSDVRTFNICISFVGNYDVSESRKQCSNRNASIINIRSEEEKELLKRLMERCREEFSDVRTLNICISYVGNYDVFEGRKQCSSRNASIINIRSGEELELLKRLMVSVPEENQGNKPFIQGQWNGSHWVLDDGKPMEYTTLPVKNFDSGDCLKLYPNVKQIAVSKCSRLRPIMCAYDII
ncbi:uncharacterized protein LOC125656589 isoform X1 [Ostrea edulis]|uniref:uncharacterized protein LOC125656589 isoform X1 n=1 Tax=Ostrea edulis TaxID=37623 RepID=UPI0024AEA2D5|nr:uncharacterized protein LOC125656589 isoform X1 [Ostrea edulis]